MRDIVQRLARECGFELAGVAPVGAIPEWERFREWVEAGMAGEMRYLTDHRAELRRDVRLLLPSARAVVCVGKLYNTGGPAGAVARCARGRDYHDVVRAGLARLAARLAEEFGPFESKACVDTAPVLERALARRAGLGWIGKNTCLVNERIGSWFVLGELITSLDLAPDDPAPDRCGSCLRCVRACPNEALVLRAGHWMVDARRCRSYLTIELGAPETDGFGCDVCQEVCPWNRRAPVTGDPAFRMEADAGPGPDLTRRRAGSRRRRGLRPLL